MIKAIVSTSSVPAKWAISFVYALQQRSLRKDFWIQFEQMAACNNYPWVCIGDLNEIGLIGEKEGGSKCRMNQLQFFLELLSYCELLDLKFKGSQFTWSNNQRGSDNVRKRLDRAVANKKWRTLFPLAQVFYRLQIGSDHCPLVVNCCVPLKKVPSLFKFETMGSTSSSCVEVIRAKWEEVHVGSLMFQMLKKLKSYRESLKVWSNKQFGNNRVLIGRLKSELATHQAHPFSNENLMMQLQKKIRPRIGPCLERNVCSSKVAYTLAKLCRQELKLLPCNALTFIT
ncbi:hypothetical protein ACSBR2_007973 [Camellia fascicularis]